MTGRRRTVPGENPLLGMIVDRSSFDEEDRKDESSVEEPQDQNLRRTRDGKIRRKLRWKPAAFRSKNNRQRPSDVSVMTERSTKTLKSTQSFHTFHSTETPVQSNKAGRSYKPIGRPNYRDTFEGVSTIANEGHYIHAKAKKGLPRSRTTPPAKSGAGFDFQSIDGESYSADGLDNKSRLFDPYGDSIQQPFRKRRPPRVAQRGQGRPSPGGSSALVRQRSPVKTAPMTNVDPKLPEVASDLSEDMDAGFILQDLEDRLVEYKIESDEPAAAGLGISPIKIPETISPFATPPRGSGRPPMAPNNERFVTPTSPSPLKQFSPEKPVQASVGITLPTCSNLSAMMAHSALLNGKKYLPDMPLTAAANSSYKTSFGTSDRSPLSTSDFARQKGAKFVKDDDSISTRTPSPDKYGNRVALVTGEGDVKRGISVKRWSKIAPGDSVSSKTYTGSQPRKQMGPADVDGGVFVDAERHLNAIHEMAAEHLAHGEYEEAFEVFEEILRGQKERYGPDHYRVGTALHNIGIVHLKSGNVEKAVKVCEEAVKVRKRTLVPNHPDVAVSLAQLGVARLECRQYKDALVAFREALQIRRNFLGPKHPKVGKILNNIGCALYEMGELDGARLAFEEALEIQRDTLRNSPSTQDTDIRNNTNQMLLSIAATLCNLGSIQFRSGMYEEAGLALEEALLIQQSVLGDDHPKVLGTIESIENVEKAVEKTKGSSMDFFSQWTATTGVSTSASSDDTFDDSPNVSKLVSMMTSLTWSRSKRFYRRIEGILPNQHEACGSMENVYEVASVGSSTNSFRRARESGHEF